MRCIRLATLVLLALIVVLGYSLVLRQNRETRLRAALALYKERAGIDLNLVMGSNPALAWPEGTSLQEVVHRIIESPPARNQFPKGLPILVDADGLREAGKTLDSPVPPPPKDSATGEPLALSHQLWVILEPLGLAAEVRDGAIVITSRGRVFKPVDTADEGPQP
jgi:hypothetical protein